MTSLRSTRLLLRSISFFALVVLCGLVALVAGAQQSCETIDTQVVIETVAAFCDDVGENQACYGNYEVRTIAQEAAPSYEFVQPGDNTRLEYIRSLFLSSLNTEENVWGIAKLRLLANLAQGTEDVTILLFGDVEIENQVESTLSFPIVGSTDFNVNVRSFPRSDRPNVIDSFSPTTELEAIGRLADSSWVRVRTPQTQAVGWVATEIITPATDAYTIEDLPIQASDSPVFSPMQAFYYQSGTNGNGTCGNLQTDGMLIQTPEGIARVSLLINEVSIELVSSSQYGATAFITSNPETGMNVNMLTGSANVEANGVSYFVDANNQTTIGVDTSGSANSAPTVPAAFDATTIQNLVLIPSILDSSVPLGTSAVGASGGNNNTSASNDGASPDNANQNGNGNGNNGNNGNRNGNSSNGNRNGRSGK